MTFYLSKQDFGDTFINTKEEILEGFKEYFEPIKNKKEVKDTLRKIKKGELMFKVQCGDINFTTVECEYFKANYKDNTLTLLDSNDNILIVADKSSGEVFINNIFIE